MTKALLVLNMQEDYLGEKRNKNMFSYNEKAIIKSVNNRIMQYDPKYVIYIKDIKKNNIISRLITKYVLEGTPGSELVRGLKVVSDNIYVKYKGNAFTNLNMYQYIEDNNIMDIEIIGIDAGGCVAQTALGAKDIGYRVEVNKKCIDTVMRKRAEIMESTLTGNGIKYI